jgi:hypothetical protein
MNNVHAIQSTESHIKGDHRLAIAENLALAVELS